MIFLRNPFYTEDVAGIFVYYVLRTATFLFTPHLLSDHNFFSEYECALWGKSDYLKELMGSGVKLKYILMQGYIRDIQHYDYYDEDDIIMNILPSSILSPPTSSPVSHNCFMHTYLYCFFLKTDGDPNFIHFTIIILCVVAVFSS